MGSRRTVVILAVLNCAWGCGTDGGSRLNNGGGEGLEAVPGGMERTETGDPEPMATFDDSAGLQATSENSLVPTGGLSVVEGGMRTGQAGVSLSAGIHMTLDEDPDQGGQIAPNAGSNAANQTDIAGRTDGNSTQSESTDVDAAGTITGGEQVPESGGDNYHITLADLPDSGNSAGLIGAGGSEPSQPPTGGHGGGHGTAHLGHGGLSVLAGLDSGGHFEIAPPEAQGGSSLVGGHPMDGGGMTDEVELAAVGGHAENHVAGVPLNDATIDDANGGDNSTLINGGSEFAEFAGSEVGVGGGLGTEYPPHVGAPSGGLISSGGAEVDVAGLPGHAASQDHAGTMDETDETTPDVGLFRLLRESPTHQRFADLVAQADLVELFSSAGPFTLFAPTDDAIDALPTDVLESWSSQPSELRRALLYHLVSGRRSADSLGGVARYEPTVALRDLFVDEYPAGVLRLGQRAILEDGFQSAENGLLYTIDAVLLPPTCDADPRINGNLITTVGELAFDTVGRTEPAYALNLDPNQGGCIAEVKVSMGIGATNHCSLLLSFEASATTETLTLASGVWRLDETCPGIDDTLYGEYTARPSDFLRLDAAISHLPEHIEASVCRANMFEIRGRAVFEKEDTRFEFYFDGVTLEGEFMHLGQNGLRCAGTQAVLCSAWLQDPNIAPNRMSAEALSGIAALRACTEGYGEQLGPQRACYGDSLSACEADDFVPLNLQGLRQCQRHACEFVGAIEDGIDWSVGEIACFFDRCWPQRASNVLLGDFFEYSACVDSGTLSTLFFEGQSQVDESESVLAQTCMARVTTETYDGTCGGALRCHHVCRHSDICSVAECPLHSNILNDALSCIEAHPNACPSDLDLFSASCLAVCKESIAPCTNQCGNLVLEDGESCDDGNTMLGDGCDARCTLEAGFTQCRPVETLKEPEGLVVNTQCTTQCGDGITAGTESCDAAGFVTMGCQLDCSIVPGYICEGRPSQCSSVCGDGMLRPGETCDDGNTSTADGCDALCQTELGYGCEGEPSRCTAQCGDGFKVPLEECDDSNQDAGDGCGPGCKIEVGFSCAVHDSGRSACSATCGDGIRAGEEACDDNNRQDGDGCSKTCQLELGFECSENDMALTDCSPVCGDGKVVSGEGCDDGSTIPGDGCSQTCQVEFGFVCIETPSQCFAQCGDGLVAVSEECDDGNFVPLDGCFVCNREPGFRCAGSPSNCASVCGDGALSAIEGCDDGNRDPGDGCDADCAIEPGYDCFGDLSQCRPRCGDGLIVGDETCDTGGQLSPGCDDLCAVQKGFTCVGSPSVCTENGDRCQQLNNDGLCDDGGPGALTDACEPGTDCSDCQNCWVVCGDGVIGDGEGCDDDNQESGDGCSETCQLETRYTCSGTPSICLQNPLCSDVCMTAQNGVCEDGGDGSETSQCDFGTDCTDCSSRPAPDGNTKTSCIGRCNEVPDPFSPSPCQCDSGCIDFADCCPDRAFVCD